ncbi:MAG: hypothetical protein HUJ22_02710 [Gracilimonas sp.]|uniref:hypothetical protein n=1 Tax=Gracilimonas sp. TaxID=1974203 RepID=UPI0019C3B04F|nr:hypothetical protein [Gracilimonas sp.]MBD3615456.1 hypothetical protein [Gracilimonas sp.]
MSDSNRFTDPRTHRYTIATPTRENPVLVVCPKCEEQAYVLPDPKKSERSAKLVCHKCGYSDRSDGSIQVYKWHDNPADSYFECDLWLQTNCLGYTLWAFSEKHLTLLEEYIEAGLRERTKDPEIGWRNASIFSRLPKWMTSSSNRNEVRKGLQKLRDRL